jgi:hypothetical protein
MTARPTPPRSASPGPGRNGGAAPRGQQAGNEPGRAGQDSAEHGQAANPQLRLVTLLACGTRALLDAAFGPVRGKGTGEQALARQLLGSLRPGMLLLADRNFYGYPLWTAAAGTGADLLWRVKASLHLPVVAELPDGSFLAHLSDPAAVQARIRRNGDRRRRGSRLGPETGPLSGITVRVIAYVLTVTAEDGTVRTERYRHITTLTDWRAYPAADLVACYAWRWAIGDRVPRMQDLPARPRPGAARPHPGPGPPGTVGLPGHLPGHPGHHRPRRGRRRPGPRPDLLHRGAARRPAHRGHRPRPPQRRAGRDRNRDPVLPGPQRQGRVCPRAVNKPSWPYRSKHGHDGPISQHASYAVTIPAPASRTRTSTDQQEHPGNHQNEPP